MTRTDAWDGSDTGHPIPGTYAKPRAPLAQLSGVQAELPAAHVESSGVGGRSASTEPEDVVGKIYHHARPVALQIRN